MDHLLRELSDRAAEIRTWISWQQLIWMASFALGVFMTYKAILHGNYKLWILVGLICIG